MQNEIFECQVNTLTITNDQMCNKYINILVGKGKENLLLDTFHSPLLIDNKGNVLDGNHHVQAARILGVVFLYASYD